MLFPAGASTAGEQLKIARKRRQPPVFGPLSVLSRTITGLFSLPVTRFLPSSCQIALNLRAIFLISNSFEELVRLLDERRGWRRSSDFASVNISPLPGPGRPRTCREASCRSRQPRRAPVHEIFTSPKHGKPLPRLPVDRQAASAGGSLRNSRAGLNFIRVSKFHVR